jgi:hypothetical protein
MDAIDEARAWLGKRKGHFTGLIDTRLMRELVQELDTRVQQPQQSTKSAPSGHQVGATGERGTLDELSDVERQEAGYPATRAMLAEALRSVYEMERADYVVQYRREMMEHIRDILSREES